MRSKIPTLGIPHLTSAAIVVLVLLVLIGFAIARSISISMGTAIGINPPIVGTATPGSVDTDANGTSSSDIEYLPVLPGAYDVEPVHLTSGGFWKGIDYKVQIATEDIFQWYEVQLAARGWTFDYDRSKAQYDPSLGYFWEDKQDKTPYVLTLDVTVVTDLSAIIPGLSKRVGVILDRIPILDKAPLYPGAQNLQQKQQPIPTDPTDMPGVGSIMMETVITYRVQATRQNIEDYYNHILPQYGWSYRGEAYDESVHAYIKGSRVFVWGIGGPESPSIGASVTLIAHENERANGWTEVELHLRGDNKYTGTPIIP